MKPIRYFASLAAGLASACAFAATPEAPTEGAAPLAWRVDDPRLSWGPCPEFFVEGCQISVLQGDPAAANADVFFRVPGGSRIVRHWHTSAEHMVLVAGEMTVTYDGHPTATLTPGTYAYGPARLPHSAECVGEAACVLAIAFEQPVDAHEGGHAP
ncbi:cupin domain-containing protein [Luteimonas vadosa]|uniref:Cupin type-2 domain-containing protein n=1 Tax=Luteimonas vadosa TaxID=1165507 RepID=A0ABP9DZ21_9GAMM